MSEGGPQYAEARAEGLFRSQLALIDQGVAAQFQDIYALAASISHHEIKAIAERQIGAWEQRAKLYAYKGVFGPLASAEEALGTALSRDLIGDLRRLRKLRREVGRHKKKLDDAVPKADDLVRFAAAEGVDPNQPLVAEFMSNWRALEDAHLAQVRGAERVLVEAEELTRSVSFVVSVRLVARAARLLIAFHTTRFALFTLIAVGVNKALSAGLHELGLWGVLIAASVGYMVVQLIITPLLRGALRRQLGLQVARLVHMGMAVAGFAALAEGEACGFQDAWATALAKASS